MLSVVAQMKALGDKNRFRISMMLMERPLCVCELLEILEIAGGTLSNHLKILKNAGLIEQQKDGKWVEYYIADDTARELLGVLEKRLEDRELVLEDRKRVRAINRTACSLQGKRNGDLKAVRTLPS